MSAPEPSELAAHWLGIALGDLSAAETLARDRSVPARQAALLGQQAAEKALKGAIIFGRATPPRTHNLLTLARLLPPEWSVHALEVNLARLSVVFEARYPSYFEPALGDEEGARLLSDAIAIIDSILEDLASRGLDRPTPR